MVFTSNLNFHQVYFKARLFSKLGYGMTAVTNRIHVKSVAPIEKPKVPAKRDRVRHIKPQPQPQSSTKPLITGRVRCLYLGLGSLAGGCMALSFLCLGEAYSQWSQMTRHCRNHPRDCRNSFEDWVDIYMNMGLFIGINVMTIGCINKVSAKLTNN